MPKLPDNEFLAVLQNALERVSVVVCEIELGEIGVAYQVASDLELDLEAALRRLLSRASRAEAA